jgi:hypothetical protein
VGIGHIRIRVHGYSSGRDVDEAENATPDVDPAAVGDNSLHCFVLGLLFVLSYVHRGAPPRLALFTCLFYPAVLDQAISEVGQLL